MPMTAAQTMGCTRCDTPTFRPGLCMACREGDAEKVETMYRLVNELEKALRSKRLTVQVMPDGVEIIEVESGDLVRKLMVTEVFLDDNERGS